VCRPGIGTGTSRTHCKAGQLQDAERTTSSRSVSVAHGIQPKDKLLLVFGYGKNLQRLADHEIVAGFGPEKARALSVLHTLATVAQSVPSLYVKRYPGYWFPCDSTAFLYCTICIICCDHVTK